jgi:GNAT superfamily N-acetyltransferase
MRVEQVTADATYALRQEVLRPHQSIAEVGFPGDDDPETAHFAAFPASEGKSVGDRDCAHPIGVVTVLHQPPPPTLPTDRDPTGWWRLRGMATAGGHRRSGVGSALVDAVLAHVAAHNGTTLWCHARLPAVAFYQRQAFATIGDPWEEPTLGPHVTMWRSVPRPQPQPRPQPRPQPQPQPQPRPQPT